MSKHASPLPRHPSLEQLQKRAKNLLKQHRAGDMALQDKLRATGARSGRTDLSGKVTLADAQFAIAREYGFESWAYLKQHIALLPVLSIEQYEQLAKDLATAHMSTDHRAVREVNRSYNTAFVADFHDAPAMQERLTKWFASDLQTPDLAVEDARQMVAHAYGFQNWGEFLEGASHWHIDPHSYSFFLNSRPPFYQINWNKKRLVSLGPQSEKEWKAIFDAIREHGITALKADGITDRALKQLTRLDQLTHVSLISDALTDDGLQSLSGMPQLLDLEIGGSKITDRGLEALSQLSSLRRFQSCWTQGISDAGAANLALCHRLECVNLMGTAAGDGLIQALSGKQHLRTLKTGQGVTNAGITLLHEIPAFKNWLGGEPKYGLMSAEAEPNYLLIDGPFTDLGLAKLVGLDGLFGLSFFGHTPVFTSAGLAPLRLLPRLGFLGCPGMHCDDGAMREIAEMPQLRMLMGQGAIATDTGWKELSRSQTIEYIWGRDCPNLTGRGFAALAAMPELRGLGVSCKRVNNASLATLPSFPALRQLMPMDVEDAGFRHVGRCDHLEKLWCMYCRDTGDAATEQITGLSKLKTYYAGMTQITDYSLELLSRMRSLEAIEFWACRGITEAGLKHLTALPELREITIAGSPNVSSTVALVFPKRVEVQYSS